MLTASRAAASLIALVLVLASVGCGSTSRSTVSFTYHRTATVKLPASVKSYGVRVEAPATSKSALERLLRIPGIRQTSYALADLQLWLRFEGPAVSNQLTREGVVIYAEQDRKRRSKVYQRVWTSIGASVLTVGLRDGTPIDRMEQPSSLELRYGNWDHPEERFEGGSELLKRVGGQVNYHSLSALNAEFSRNRDGIERAITAHHMQTATALCQDFRMKYVSEDVRGSTVYFVDSEIPRLKAIRIEVFSASKPASAKLRAAIAELQQIAAAPNPEMTTDQRAAVLQNAASLMLVDGQYEPARQTARQAAAQSSRVQRELARFEEQVDYFEQNATR